MLGQIFLYLVPGFLFFIFLPACIFVVFEGWDYVAAIYYAFVTLTTIGFGDIVAGKYLINVSSLCKNVVKWTTETKNHPDTKKVLQKVLQISTYINYLIDTVLFYFIKMPYYITYY